MNTLQKRLNEKYKSEELIVISYSKMKEPAIVKCVRCEEEYSLERAENFLRKKRICKKCNPTEEFKKTIDRFLEWIKDSNFILEHDIGREGNSQAHIRCRCKDCGLLQENKTIYDYLAGKECYCKTKSTKKPIEVLLKELDNEYVLLEEYTNTDDKLLFKHISCGEVFRMRVADLLRYKGICPNCNFNNSKGEQKIIEYLNKNKIEYQREVPIIIEGKRFRYDFYLPQFNIFIEYNGIQHYEPVAFFGGEEAFEIRKKYDQIKKQYCLKNNIELIILKYDEDIENNLCLKGVV